MSLLELLNYRPLGINKWLSLAFLLIGIFNFTYYNIKVYMKYGLLKSISISWCYVDPHYKFQIFMWINILCILIINANIGYLIVCILFGIMTCNPSINRGNIYFIPHMIGAISAISLGLLLEWILYNNPYPSIVSIIGIIILVSMRKRLPLAVDGSSSLVYWIEMLTLIEFMTGLLSFIIVKLF